LDSYAALGTEDEQFTKKQINAKKQERTAGWREEQPRSGVVRAWMVRKVNSDQKKPGKRKKASFALDKQFAGPLREAGRK
jgi:hypothetical protein